MVYFSYPSLGVELVIQALTFLIVALVAPYLVSRREAARADGDDSTVDATA